METFQTLGINESAIPLIVGALVLLSIWSLVWKGVALWKSARNEHKVWFVILFLVNTVGILEILYIFIFSKKKQQKSTQNELVQ